MGNAMRKVAWLGRTASMVFGLALVLALMFGAATTALAAVPGNPFRLGQLNVVDAATRLAGANDGPMLIVDNNSAGVNARALDLRVEPGKAPMRVNSQAKVANLNSDQLDGKSEEDFYAAGSKVTDSSHADQADTVGGKSASQIGVNGVQRVFDTSDFDSNSAKDAAAFCPAGKVVVGTGAEVSGGTSGSYPATESDVEIRIIKPDYEYVYVRAAESQPISANWSVTAYAICATAP